MTEPDFTDLRAIETILNALKSLDAKDQVRVLTWVIDKLELALDMKLAIKNARLNYRNHIEMAWDKVPRAMESASEFLAAAAPESMADRVLVIATFLQLRHDDPDRTIVTGREINGALRNMRLSVSNVTDCIYTLVRRSPPHIAEAGRAPNRRDWKGYRVTESGIDYVYERIVQFGSDDQLRRGARK
jgi:hypothetical protein